MAKSNSKDQPRRTLKAEEQNYGVVYSKARKNRQPTEAEIVAARIELLRARESRIQRELLSLESLYSYLEESHILSLEDLEVIGEAVYKIELLLKSALKENEGERISLVENYEPKPSA